MQTGWMFLSFNGNILFTFFVINFIKVRYFSFGKWWSFFIIPRFIFVFSQYWTSIKIKVLSSSNKLCGKINGSSAPIVVWMFQMILSTQKHSKNLWLLFLKKGSFHWLTFCWSQCYKYRWHKLTSHQGIFFGCCWMSMMNFWMVIVLFFKKGIICVNFPSAKCNITISRLMLGDATMLLSTFTIEQGVRFPLFIYQFEGKNYLRQ